MAAETFQELLEAWFLGWLMGHRDLSRQTVLSYRDTFRLVFAWLSSERGVAPDRAGFADLDRQGVVDFLDWLRDARGCSAKTVNCRLTAIKSFASYVACERPERSAWAASVASVRQRKESRPALDFLTPAEVGALVDACDQSTPEGRRDAMMVKLLFNTGFRVSELVGLRASSFEFAPDGSCSATVVGKGRKERTVPLWPETAAAVRSWMGEAGVAGEGHLLAGRGVEHLTRSGARSRLDALVARAREARPSLRAKRVTPHVLRHSTAMAMLAAGVSLSTIAIWLGHESIETTHRYMVADMELKREALRRAQEKGKNPFGDPPQAVLYEPDESVLAFLESL